MKQIPPANHAARGGWELNLPEISGEFSHDSQYGNFALAMDWMAAGRLKADGLYEIRPAAQAQQVYDDIYQKKTTKLTAIFDWQGAENGGIT